MAVLERTRELDDGSGLIFPSPTRRGRPLSDMSLTKLLYWWDWARERLSDKDADLAHGKA